MQPIRVLLGISRMIVLIIIGLLIISPFIRTSVTRQDKPYFVVAQDNSVSIPPLRDKAGFAERQSTLIDNISEVLDNRFQVKTVLFGSHTAEGKQCSFTDPVTDPGELFAYLRIFARTHDLGGVFIASDGVATKGNTFPEASKNFPYPITILASGDSTRFPDVRILEVVTNDWVRKNSKFPVRVYFNTIDYAGSVVKVQISSAQGIFAEKIVNTAVESAPFAEFQIQSPEKGVMQLVARIIPEKPDKNQDNDSKFFSVKIIEQTGEILFLYESAHPDINAIAQTLEKSNLLNINTLEASDFAQTEADYDLIILHGLPSRKHPLEELLKKAVDNQMPVLFAICNTTDPDIFNRVNHGMVIDNRRKTREASQGILNQSFTLFTLPSDFNSHLNRWPPLDLSFETYMLDPGSQILLKQKILNIDLPDPLVAFSTTLGVKHGFICGDGVWLWKLHEFLEHKNHDYFDEWLSRSIQYLMLDEKKDKFRVVIPDELFAYSPVRINGHLLNSSLEAVNDPDVSFTVTDSAGLKTEYQMGRINDYYELNTSGFAPGSYRYSAETKLGNESFRREGLMTMMIRPVEQSEPVADFESLRSVASGTNGAFFSPGQESGLLSYLNNLKPSDLRVRIEYKWYDLINFKWLLAILFLLLAMEWFLRRWFGIR